MYPSYHLSHSDAMRIIATILEALEKDNKGATVAVVDAHGELIALIRTDGCPLSSVNTAINKAFTAAREHASSHTLSAGEDSSLFSRFGDPRYTNWGGGVPIRYAGIVIGAVGVSGLPEEEDIMLAKLGARASAE